MQQQQQHQEQEHDLAGGGGGNGGKVPLTPTPPPNSVLRSSDVPAARAKWMLVSGTPKKPTVIPPPSYISPKKQMHVSSLNKQLSEGAQMDEIGGTNNQMHVTFDPYVMLKEENKVRGPKGESPRRRKKKVVPLSACTPDQLLKEVAKRMIAKASLRDGITSPAAPGTNRDSHVHKGGGDIGSNNNNDTNSAIDSSVMMDEATNYTTWLNDITESYRLRAALVLGDYLTYLV